MPTLILGDDGQEAYSYGTSTTDTSQVLINLNTSATYARIYFEAATTSDNVALQFQVESGSFNYMYANSRCSSQTTTGTYSTFNWDQGHYCTYYNLGNYNRTVFTGERIAVEMHVAQEYIGTNNAQPFTTPRVWGRAHYIDYGGGFVTTFFNWWSRQYNYSSNWIRRIRFYPSSGNFDCYAYQVYLTGKKDY